MARPRRAQAPVSRDCPSPLLVGLNFAPGIEFQHAVWNRWNLCIHDQSGNSSSFLLVVSFGCCKWRLSSGSVGFLLQAVIGGFAASFDVMQLSDRVFCFSVCSKKVGIIIYNLRSFECDEFKLFFHLWNFDGPNWTKEYHDFCLEDQSSWAEVDRNGKVHRSYSQAVKSNVLSGANRIPLGKRINHNSDFHSPIHLHERRSIFHRITYSHSKSCRTSFGFPVFRIFLRGN
jgi:hypothetical protein